MSKKMEHLTVEHLWQCERLGTPAVSPDGRWVVIDQTTYSIERNESETQLWLYATDGRAGRRQLTQAGKKNTAPVWSPDGRSIAFCAKRGEGKDADDAPQLYVISPEGGEARRVATVAGGVSGIRWFPDGKRIAAIAWRWPELRGERAQAARRKEIKESKVQAKVIETDNYRYWDHWICDGSRPRLIEITLATGKVRDLFEGHTDWSLGLGDPGATSYAISPDGREIVWVQPTEVTRLISPDRLMRLDLASGKARPLATEALPGMWLGSPTYAPDGGSLAVLATPASAPSQHTRLMLIDVKRGGARRLAPAWPRSVGTYGSANPAFTPDGQAILFAAEDAGVQPLYRLALDADAPEVVADGGQIAAFSQSADGTRLAFTRASIDHPARLMTLALGADAEPRRLDRTNGFLDKIALGPWESRTFTGWNGEPVQAFICYPPGYRKGKKYPLLQDIHGGPHAAHLDTWHYRWNMHVFAAQGYVVAAVNYHGSSGFDEPFLGSIDGDLGHREFADIEAVTDALIEEGVADPKRLYAAGGSYGGYMVAWINGHTDRYRATVCHAGVYNWVSQFGDDGYLWLHHELGTWPWEDPARWHRQSAHSFAANFKTPTLVIHGELDYRVPYYEGLEYYNTLRAKGVPARLVVFPDENHWILKPQNSRLWYREFFDWLKRF